MLSKVKVYGHLAEHLGQSTFEALIRTPAEAVRFLICNFPELRGLMRDGYYKVAVGRHDLQLADCPEQLHYPVGSNEVVSIIPVVTGAGGNRGGVASILLGAALIGVAIASAGAGFSLGAQGVGFIAAGSAPSALAAAAGNIGIGLVLTGTASLLSPTPEVPTLDGDPRNDPNNFAFSGVQNTAREGVPVPIAYGEVIVGSVVISAGLNVEEI